MGAAVLALVGSVIGGLLVLLGGYLTHKREDRRHWQTLLYEAASELVLSYKQDSAAANALRRRGRPAGDANDDTYVVQRQRAKSRLRTLPGGLGFEREIVQMGAANERVWAAYGGSDVDFASARQDLVVCIEAFQRKVAASLR